MNYRNWAYVGLGVGLTASVTANVASVVLRESAVPLALQVPFAVIWPLLTYIAIEILSRTPWSAGWKHYGVRLVLAAPVGLVAAFVSYLHQHDLMRLGQEPGLAQGFGPLAVDGLLFGAAFVLISTKEKEESSVEYGATQPIDPAWDEPWEDFSSTIAPISPAPITEKEEVIRTAPPRQRSSWDARQVAELILSGATSKEIEEKTGAKPASIGRFRKVTKMIQTDPRVTIDPAREKVTSDNIKMIRELVGQ